MQRDPEPGSTMVGAEIPIKYLNAQGDSVAMDFCVWTRGKKSCRLACLGSERRYLLVAVRKAPADGDGSKDRYIQR